MNNLLKNGELKQGALKRFSLQWVFCQKSIPRRLGLLGVLAFNMIKTAVQSKINKSPYLRKHHWIFRRGVFALSALVLGSVFSNNLWGDTAINGKEKSLPIERQEPYGAILYYNGKGGGFDPKTKVSVMCIGLEKESGSWHKQSSGLYGLLPLKTDQIQKLLPTVDPKNPKIVLSDFSMQDWKQLCEKNTETSDFAALCVSNSGKQPLHMMLPKEITMPLFLYGDHLVLDSHSNLNDSAVFIGIKGHALGQGLMSGSFFFKNNIIPSTVTINGSLTPKRWYIIARSKVVFNGPVPKELIVHHSNIRIGPSDGNTLDGKFNFYGVCAFDCDHTTRMTGEVGVGSDEQPFSSEHSQKPNNGLGLLRNVVFEPKTIFIEMPMVKDRGFFDIKGQVNLSKTLVQLDSYDYKDVPLGQRILIITSDRPISGTPTVKFLFNGHNLRCRWEVEDKKAYVIIEGSVKN